MQPAHIKPGKTNRPRRSTHVPPGATRGDAETGICEPRLVQRDADRAVEPGTRATIVVVSARTGKTRTCVAVCCSVEPGALRPRLFDAFRRRPEWCDGRVRGDAGRLPSPECDRFPSGQSTRLESVRAACGCRRIPRTATSPARREAGATIAREQNRGWLLNSAHGNARCSWCAGRYRRPDVCRMPRIRRGEARPRTCVSSQRFASCSRSLISSLLGMLAGGTTHETHKVRCGSRASRGRRIGRCRDESGELPARSSGQNLRADMPPPQGAHRRWLSNQSAACR